MPSNRVISDGAAMPGHGTKFGSNRVVVKQSAIPTETETGGTSSALSNLNKPALIAAATEMGVEVELTATKAEIVAAIDSQVSDDTTA